jgi:hypothetical protein
MRRCPNGSRVFAMPRRVPAIDYGPGYRVYYAHDDNALILLLCGGDKRTQAKDIEQAHEYWKDYKARKPKPPVPSGGSSTKRRRGRRLH